MIFFVEMKKTGGTDRPDGSYSDLITFFSEGDLFDLQHSGDPLSWRGKRVDQLIRCRLDRAVSNTLWAECFHQRDANISAMKDPITSPSYPSLIKVQGKREECSVTIEDSAE